MGVILGKCSIRAVTVVAVLELSRIRKRSSCQTCQIWATALWRGRLMFSIQPSELELARSQRQLQLALTLNNLEALIIGRPR